MGHAQVICRIKCSGGRLACRGGPASRRPEKPPVPRWRPTRTSTTFFYWQDAQLCCAGQESRRYLHHFAACACGAESHRTPASWPPSAFRSRAQNSQPWLFCVILSRSGFHPDLRSTFTLSDPARSASPCNPAMILPKPSPSVPLKIPPPFPAPRRSPEERGPSRPAAARPATLP